MNAEEQVVDEVEDKPVVSTERSSWRTSSRSTVFDRTSDERDANGDLGLWPWAKARISHRLAMHLPVAPFRANNDSPIISFTFDDVPKSAATTGADILAEFDAHATFYVAAGLIGAPSPHWDHVNAADIVALHQRGHEIGCHTFSHKKAFELDAAKLEAEIEQNLRHLQALEPGISLKNFAYPYGVGAYRLKRPLRQRFHSCRSVLAGINSGRIDLQFLRSIPLVDGEIDDDGIERAIDGAKAVNGWLIFYSHDVAEVPSAYGCSPRSLRHALEAARRHEIRIASVSEALRHLGF